MEGSRQKGRKEMSLSSREDIPLSDFKLQKFEQIFEENGGQIATKNLKRIMYSNTSRDKVDSFFRNIDKNADEMIDFHEFAHIMKEVSSDIELTKIKKALRTAIGSVVPQSVVEQKNLHYYENYSCCPPPIFIILISLIELGFFIYYYIKIDKKNTVIISGVPLYSPLIYNPYKRYQVWRFITYMFIHDGIMHILSNMIMQVIIGLPLELFHKPLRVATVYMLGVIAGSLGTSIFDNRVYLVGASGGCYSLIGAHFATIIINWRNMSHDWMSGPIKFVLSAPVQLLFWTLFCSLDISWAIWCYYNNDISVAYVAHFAGLLIGLLAGIPVLKNFEVLRWEKIIKWVSFVTFLILLLFAITWNGFYPHFPPTKWE